MSKSTHFFGQSVFGQLISLIDRNQVKLSVKNTGSDRFCKGFYTWDHLVSMLFCTLSNCTSLREVAAGCLGLKGKTEHLGLSRLPRRSTLSDANRLRTPKVFESIYWAILKKYRSDISDSRLKKFFGKELYIFDSTTISLFSDILKCAGQRPKSGKQKGGLKVHTLLNADEQVPQLLWFSSAATNDVCFWDKIDFKENAIYLFDRGYIDYRRYDQLTKTNVSFVTRLKDNASFETAQEIEIEEHVDTGVIKDEWVKMPIRTRGKIVSWIKLRRIAYWDSANECLIAFLTNIAEEDMDGGQIAQLYKQRWQIELLFKQLKQNFPLKYFLGENVNAIIIQVWCAMIANLLLTIIRERVKRRWAFSNVVSFVRLHLFNHIHLIRFLEDPEKDWQKELLQPQIRLFDG
jgi:hypothetical protein